MDINKVFKSFVFAYAGIVDMYKSEVNAKVHFTIMTIVLVAGFFFSISLIEWCVLILAIAMVLAAEAFNTALEHLTNLVSPDFHPLAGRVKDAAAGGVLLVAIGAAVVGLIIFLPKAWILLFG